MVPLDQSNVVPKEPGSKPTGRFAFPFFVLYKLAQEFDTVYRFVDVVPILNSEYQVIS